MLTLLTKKAGEKEEKTKEQQRGRDEIDLDHSEGESCNEEEGNELIVLRPKTTKSSSSKVAGGGSSIDKFYKPTSIEEAVENRIKGVNVRHKVQTALTTQKREEWRDRACEYVCQFLRLLASRILNLTCNSSASERNWWFIQRGATSFFMIAVTLESAMQEDDNEGVQDRALQGASTSQSQAKRKRPRKKKLKSLESLMRDVSAEDATYASSSETEDDDGDLLMHSSDSGDE